MTMISMNCLLAYVVFVFISIAFSVGSENCSKVTKFLKTKNLFILNSTEMIEFLPIEYSYIESDWDDACVDIKVCNLYGNEIEYKGNRIRTLSNTELGISDEQFTKSIYKSFEDNEMLHDVINVFSNRYVVSTQTSKVLVYSIQFGIPFKIVNPNCTNYIFRYQMSKIKGLVCKVRNESDIRYNVQCDDVTLYLNPIDEKGQLDCQTKCRT